MATNPTWSELVAQNDNPDQQKKVFFEDFTPEELADLEKNYYYYQQNELINQLKNEI